MSPVISGNIDVALIALCAFVLFFIGLVVYLNRESRREGFPLEEDFGGRLHSAALLHDASLKTFKLPFGRGSRTTADYAREAVDLPVSRERFRWLTAWVRRRGQTVRRFPISMSRAIRVLCRCRRPTRSGSTAATPIRAA